MKRLIVGFAAFAAWSVPAFAAEDKTVDYGETLEITDDTAYANLVVNGTLNVAEGKTLTCDTFILGDNLDYTQDKVAKMTVASNATVTVNNKETLNGSSYVSTGYCQIGVNSRAELTLEGGSTFAAGGRIKLSPNCTGTVDKVVYVKVTLNDATLSSNGPLEFRGSNTTSSGVETSVVTLNGAKSQLKPYYVSMPESSTCARIKFNGGKLLTDGWWSWGQQAVLQLSANKQNLRVESVNGNPVWLKGSGGSNTHSFFYCQNPYPWNGGSHIYFEGVGPLVLECPVADGMPLCWTSTTPSYLDFGSVGSLRLRGKVTLGNAESVGLGTNVLKKVKLEIDAASSFDVCGTSLEIAALESAGTITNSSSTCSVLAVGGTSGDVVLSSPTLSAGVSLVKVGTGKLYAPAGPLENIEVREGAFDFCDRKTVGFPCYRYWVYRKSQGGGDNGAHCGTVKLCELALYNDGVDVCDQATHVSWKSYGSNDKTPANLFTSVADNANSWVSEWYRTSDSRSSNCLFAVIHIGGAPSFKFTGLAPYTTSLSPEYDAIADRPILGKMHETVTSYKFRQGSTAWFGYTNPEYFRFQGGYGNDQWVDLEDWESRGRYTRLGSGDSWNWSEEFPLTYPVNPVSVENLTVAAGTEWTIDCLQTDLTVGALTLGAGGTLKLTNYAAARAAGLLDRHGLPVGFATLVGEQNLKTWSVVIDGEVAERELCAVDGRLAFVKPGAVLFIR